MAAGDVTLLNHEPVWVVFSGNNLGLCAPESIVVEFSVEWVNQMAHQTGGRVLEAYHKPGNPTIKFKVIEVLALTNWQYFFPAGSPQTATGPISRFSPTLITAGSTTPHAGQKASGYAQELYLRPAATYVDTSTETDRDWWFPLAWCTNVGPVSFSIDEAFAFDLTFSALYNVDATEGEHMWIRGKKTGAWTDA